MNRRTLRRSTALVSVSCLVSIACATAERSASGEHSARTRSEQTSSPPYVSPDFEIESPVSDFLSNAEVRAVASRPGEYLVLYDAHGDDGGNLTAVRLRADGQLQGQPRLVAPATGNIANWYFPARAVYAGTQWLIVYAGSRTEYFSVTLSNEGSLGVTRPLPAGCMTPPTDLSVGLTALVWNGTRALLSSSEGLALWLDGDGTPGSCITITGPARYSVPGRLSGGQMAWNGSYFAAQYAFVPNDLFANRSAAEVFVLSSTGQVLSSAIVGGESAPGRWWSSGDVASNGQNFLVCAEEPQLSGPFSNSVCRILDLHGGGAAALSPSQYVDPTYPSLGRQPYNLQSMHAHDGSYLLHLRDYVLRLDGAGRALAPAAPFPNAFPNSRGTYMTTDGASVLLLSDSRGIRYDSNLARLDASPIALLSGPNPQDRPRIARNGGSYLVAWQEARTFLDTTAPARTLGTFATRLSAAGSVIDAPSLTVASSRGFNEVEASGSDFLVLDSVDFGLGDGVRVRADGTMTSQGLGALFAPGARPESHVVESDGSSALLVWHDWSSGTNRASSISSGGALSSPVDLPAPGLLVRDAVFDGSNYVVVFHESGAQTHAMRVGPELQLLDSQPSLILGTAARLVGGGDQLLLYWWKELPDRQEVLASRLTRALEPLDPEGVVLATPPRLSGSHQVLWDGARFWVLWVDQERRLRGQRVAADLTPLDSEPSSIADRLVTTFSSLASSPGEDGQIMVAYVQHDPGWQASHRLRGRFVSGSAPGNGGSGGAGGSSGSGGGSGSGGSATGGGSGEGMGGGAAGEAGTSGRAGAGATASGGAGARPGAGGTAMGAAGAADSVTAVVSDDEGGCGCRVAHGGSAARTWWLGLCIATLLRRRRRAGVVAMIRSGN